MMLFIAGAALAQNPDGIQASISIGNDVDVSKPVHGNVLAMGGTLVIDAPVDGNVYGMATTVHITPRGSVTGTLNLVAESLHVQGKIGGLKGVVEVLELDGPVRGDTSITFQTLDLGNKARLLGAVDYSAPEPLPTFEKRARGPVVYTAPTDDTTIGFDFDIDIDL